MRITLCTNPDSQVLAKFLRDILEGHEIQPIQSLHALNSDSLAGDLVILEESLLQTTSDSQIRQIMSPLEGSILILGVENHYEKYEPLIPELIWDYVDLPLRAASFLRRVAYIQNELKWQADQSRLRKVQTQLNQFQLATEQSPVSIVITDPAGNIEFVNKCFQELSGYSRAELIGKNPRVLGSGLQSKSFYAKLWETILSGNVWRGEFHNKNKRGESYFEAAVISPIKDADGEITHLIGVKEDLTQSKRDNDRRKALEKQIQRTQRMEAIGTLAGGIAHDFNNILQSMYLYLGMALDDLDEGDVKDDIKQVQKSALRAKDLVEQILTFSRTGELEKSEVQIQYVIKEAIKFLKSTLPASIRLSEDISTSCPSVLCDPAQIHQVFLNLCSNAYESMEEKRGKIHVELKELTITPEQAREENIAEGRLVRLRISDDGKGMPESIVEKIFDPFFSTKPPGKGSGLGLSVAFAIVEEMGGEIRVKSAEGSGTEISLYLPALPEKPVDTPIEIDPSLSLSGLRVHIVERDLSVLAGMSLLLERHGALVTTHDDSQSLLSNENFWKDEACMILAAYDMHSMDGLTLAESIKGKRPDHVFVLMSGDDLEATLSPIKLQVLDSLIRKPWEPNELVTRIAALMASHGLNNAMQGSV